ncbi:MAG TPA: DUF4920 domain-containing protein [Saprospiraceae bacterium]|nr:DUF4920 domain-containing protein [Saprospiraceae bacterium]
MKNFFFLLLVLGLVACQSETKEATEAGTSNTEASTDGTQYFGAKITPDNAIPFAKMLGEMGDLDSFPVKVKGTITDVCQKKGCWMRISDDNGQEMLVQFEDYGFFMPKDAAGREVIIDGYAYNETTDVKTLKHYAADAGQPKEVIDAITEPQNELKYMAKGVIIYK